MRNGCFIFEGYSIEPKKRRAIFNYSLEKGRSKYKFTESLILPFSSNILSADNPVIKKILDNLLLILGISYWKTYCPPNLEIRPFALSQKQARFWNTLYTKGLGEFFYKNKIDCRGLVQFPSYETRSHRISHETWSHKFKNRSLLLMGGGKDSIVAGELLRKEGKPFDLYILNPVSLQQRVGKLLGGDIISVQRTLDPELLRLNANGAYNGHVPISAMYAFTGLLAAALYDYKYIAAANEKSANYGNMKYLGHTVNHQWSKSAEFERLFQEYVREFITPDIKYYSFLRPYTELEITEKFSRYPKYFPVFSSCNTNFRIRFSPRSDLYSRDYRGRTSIVWCGKCPKCAFIFAALAAYIPKNDVVKIFGKNLLADKALAPIYEELLGLKRHKPFECVGTPEETKRAFRLIRRRGEFNNDFVLCALKS